MRKQLETDSEPLKKPNRRKKLRAQKTRFWCSGCDCSLVPVGTKCIHCGTMNGKRKIKYD